MFEKDGAEIEVDEVNFQSRFFVVVVGKFVAQCGFDELSDGDGSHDAEMVAVGKREHGAFGPGVREKLCSSDQVQDAVGIVLHESLLYSGIRSISQVARDTTLKFGTSLQESIRGG